MSLPKIELPLFEMTIPSSGKKAKFRPFTVREEKILLIAQETKELDQIILAIKQIISNCMPEINVDDLPMFDLEFIIVNIRAKSVNNALEFSIIDTETDETIMLNVDLNNVSIQFDERHSKKIKVSDDYTMIMKYPSIDVLKNMVNSDKAEKLLDMMISCIDVLVSNDGDKIYKFSDFTQTEVLEFVESLSSKTLDDIKLFFETIPSLKIEVPYINKNGNKKTFIAEGLSNFFI